MSRFVACFSDARLLFLCLATVAQAQSDRGAIELRVVAAGTSLPVPYADVSIASGNFSAFTDSAGTLVIRLFPAGTFSVRVRRVGFRPLTTRVTVAAGEVQRIRVPLEIIAVRLASIRVGADVCPGGGNADTAVVTVMQQARLNGERYAMLAEQYPFSMMTERIFGEQGIVPIHWSGREPAKRGDRVVQHHDTVEVSGRPAWRYAPGNLIQHTNETLRDGTIISEKMMIPHLMDLADEAFVTTHCFRFAGITGTDSGGRAFRVDFRPGRQIRTRDVRGSMYLDTATFQILKTTLFAQRPPLNSAATAAWQVRVDTWFREVLPGIPVIDRVESTTTLENTPANSFVQRVAATEDHRRLDLRFFRGHPGDAGVVTAATEDVSAGTVPVSCAWSGAAPPDSVTVVAAGLVARLCYASLDEPMVLSLSRELEVAGVIVPAGQNTVRVRKVGDRWLAIFHRGTGDAVEIGRGEPTVETINPPAAKFVVSEGRDGTDPAFVLDWNSLRFRMPLWSRR